MVLIIVGNILAESEESDDESCNQNRINCVETQHLDDFESFIEKYEQF
jgi:hypothetical protein